MNLLNWNPLLVVLVSQTYASFVELRFHVTECPSGWVRYENNKCFRLFQEKKGAEEAQRDCQKLGSNLASFSSADEHRFLVDLILNEVNYDDLSHTWVGSKRIGKSDFRWINRDLSPFYAPEWFRGYPIAGATAACLGLATLKERFEDSFAIYGNGFNFGCDNKLPFICQKKILSVSSETTIRRVIKRSNN